MLMGSDVVSLLTIGETNALVPNEGCVDSVLTANGLHKMLSWAQFSVPIFLLFRLLSPLSQQLDSVFRNDRKLFAYGQRAADQTRRAQEGSAPMNFFATALHQASRDKKLLETGQGELRDVDIAMDAAGFQLAGSETVGITLTFLIWRVLGHWSIQKRLEEEVASLDEVTDANCEKLPFLNAVIQETLRLHGAAPTALRRVVPKGGAILADRYIPAGKMVATQAWSIHRDESLWSEPLSFYPERWLADVVPGRTTDTFMPWGGGSRICAGVHLARMEIRLATAVFFRQCCGARLAPSVTQESMHVVDRFNTVPISGRCEVVIP
jgi:cytochrome P450